MATVKTANYTPEQVQTMREAYEKATDAETRETVVNEIAEKFGKSKRSIISKMSREGFYIKKVAVSAVTGAKPAKKEELAANLRAVSGRPMVSAEKLNKTDLLDLITDYKSFNEVPAEFAETEETTEES